jgi:hypothetical protein
MKNNEGKYKSKKQMMKHEKMEGKKEPKGFGKAGYGKRKSCS